MWAVGLNYFFSKIKILSQASHFLNDQCLDLIVYREGFSDQFGLPFGGLLVHALVFSRSPDPLQDILAARFLRSQAVPIPPLCVLKHLLGHGVDLSIQDDILLICRMLFFSSYACRILQVELSPPGPFQGHLLCV